MAIVMEETPTSPEWVNGAVVKHYLVTGTSDDMLVIQYLLSHTAAVYEGLLRQPYPSVVPQWVDSVEDRGLWDCDVQYGQYQAPEREQDEIGTVVVLYDTGGGGSVRMEYSYATLGMYGSPPGGLRDFNHAIGVSPDRMHIEGVDVPVAAFAMTVRKVWSKSTLPDPDVLFDLSYHVNSSTVMIEDTTTGETYHFQAGELLFEYATNGELRADDGMEYTYHFKAARNLVNYDWGGITIGAKRGWDAAWMFSEPALDAQKRQILVPRQVNVEQVLLYGNLNLLGL